MLLVGCRLLHRCILSLQRSKIRLKAKSHVYNGTLPVASRRGLLTERHAASGEFSIRPIK